MIMMYRLAISNLVLSYFYLFIFFVVFEYFEFLKFAVYFCSFEMYLEFGVCSYWIIDSQPVIVIVVVVVVRVGVCVCVCQFVCIYIRLSGEVRRG